MRRTGSRNRYDVRRIPSDVKAGAVGLKLAAPVGELTQLVVISRHTQAVRLSLRANDPIEVKRRQAAIDAFLENVWTGLRENGPVVLTHKQATVLAGDLYRAWASGEGRENTTAIEADPDVEHSEIISIG